MSQDQYEVVIEVSASCLKARIEGGEWFSTKDRRHVVRLEAPAYGSGEAAFRTYGEGWFRDRDFVGEHVDPGDCDWSCVGRTISFYFTDQLTAAKVRLLA